MRLNFASNSVWCDCVRSCEKSDRGAFGCPGGEGGSVAGRFKDGLKVCMVVEGTYHRGQIYPRPQYRYFFCPLRVTCDIRSQGQL